MAQLDFWKASCPFDFRQHEPQCFLLLVGNLGVDSAFFSTILSKGWPCSPGFLEVFWQEGCLEGTLRGKVQCWDTGAGTVHVPGVCSLAALRAEACRATPAGCTTSRGTRWAEAWGSKSFSGGPARFFLACFCVIFLLLVVLFLFFFWGNEGSMLAGAGSDMISVLFFWGGGWPDLFLRRFHEGAPLRPGFRSEPSNASRHRQAGGRRGHARRAQGVRRAARAFGERGARGSARFGGVPTVDIHRCPYFFLKVRHI